MIHLLAIALLNAPTIVERKAWDPTPAKRSCCRRYDQPLEHVLKWIVVHHSDFIDAPGPLGIEAYHLQVSGFSDIGYHFVVSPDGTIYEGRSLDTIGAHAGITREGIRDPTKDPDYGSIGIVLDGDYTQSSPSLAQANALVLLVQHLSKRFSIAPDHVIGHREVKAKLIDARGLTFVGELKICPGDAGMQVVDGLRQHTATRTAPLTGR